MIYMATLTTSNNIFDQAFTLEKQTGTIFTLSTTGTYNAKDIQLTMNVRSATATLSAPVSASITQLTYTYNSTSGCFGVTGSSTISGTAVFTISQSGWVENTVKQKVNGSASLSNIIIPKVGIQASFEGSPEARKPSIQKQNTPSGVTNAANGNATTAVPTSGVYVAVRSPANTTTVTAVAAVTDAGYGTTAQYAATNVWATVGAAQSDMTYIPIIIGTAESDTASADATVYTTDGSNAGTNISGIVGTKTSTEPNSGYYLAFSISGSGNSKITNSGWFSSGALASASTTAIRYFPIQAATYSAGISLSAVTVTPSVEITNALTYGFTTTKPSGTNGTNYLTINPGADTPTYSATGTASITKAGYLATGNKYSGTTKAVSVAAGQDYFVPIIVPNFSGGDLSITASTNNISTTAAVTISASGTFLSTGTANYGVTSTKPTGTDGTNYLKIDGSGTVSTTGIVASDYTVSKGITYYNNSAGVIAAHSSTTTAVAGNTISGTATVAVTPDIIDNFDPLYMPIVTSVGFGGGGLTVNTNTNVISTTAVVTISAAGTFLSTGTANYGVTSTKPAGTDGTNYLTINSNGVVSTTGVVTSSVKMTRAKVTYTNIAGAITTHNNAQAVGSASTTTGVPVNIIPKINNFTSLYMPIITPEINGGELTGSTTNTISTNMTTSTSAVYYIDATATGTATRAVVTYSNDPGAIAEHSNTTAISAVGLNVGSVATRMFIPTAVGSVVMNPGDGSCVLQTSNNVITSDTNTSGVSVTFRGGGAVSATAKITTAGYTPTNTSFATGSSTTSNTVDLTKYITGVTLTKGKTFSITVPNGALNSDGTNNETITFVFTVANDNTGNVTVQGPD